MWVYEKRLEYPVKIANTNPKLAKMIITQYGGPDGELGASLRYLSQRYSMPYPELKAILTALILTQTRYKNQKCIIKSDSAYCVNMLNEWIYNWARNGWVRTKNQPVENLELVQKI